MRSDETSRVRMPPPNTGPLTRAFRSSPTPGSEEVGFSESERGVAKPAEGAFLELSDALGGESELAPDVFEGSWCAVDQAVAASYDSSFALREPCDGLSQPVGDVGEFRSLFGVDRLVSADEVGEDRTVLTNRCVKRNHVGNC